MMSVCISSGAKQVISRMLKRFEGKFPDQKQFLSDLRVEVEEMPICKAGKIKGKRAPSKWQECIKKEMTGKPWNPSRIKELAKKYKKGLCP